jgi:hypothetical protein
MFERPVDNTWTICEHRVNERSRRNPASGIGPLGTVIQDLVSMLIGFAIAREFMGWIRMGWK